MFKSLFEFKKKQEISIFPERASASISSFALLISTLGSPFSEWKPIDVEVSPEEDSNIRYACHCFQLYMYPTYFEDMRVGEVMLGCALEVAKGQRDQLIDLMNLGYSVIADGFHAGVQQFGADDDGIRQTMRFVAMTWIRVFATQANELTEDQENTLAEKLVRCLYHARDRANIILKPMAQSVKDFDLEVVGQLNFFERDLSLFERNLQNRQKFEFLYPRCEPPNAQLQLEAKIKEDELAQSLVEKHEVALARMEKKLEDVEGPQEKEFQFEAIKDWYFECDDILVELRNISGKRCKLAAEVITGKQKEMVGLLEPIIFNILGPGARPAATFAEFQEICDSYSHSARTRVFMQIKHLSNDEVMPHVFTLPLDDFAGLKDFGIEKSSLETFVEAIGGLSNMTLEQRDYVETRLALV